jgi:nitroimidazol reductase NimA-like FMN-containing flavoprotein (pyridoxamine 5'-phosphate oxidase superfamily)
MDNQEMEAVEKEYDQLLENNFVQKLKLNKKQLSPDELRKAIAAFLEENVICTLATCSDNIPRSTPVRYRSRGLTLYILAEGGMKVKNIRDNPRVSVSLYGAYSDFMSVKGLQLWGSASIIEPEEVNSYREAVAAVDPAGREDLKKLGLDKIQHNLKAIKIVVERARYLNIAEGIFNQILRVSEPDS